jgi:hypothetical protein
MAVEDVPSGGGGHAGTVSGEQAQTQLILQGEDGLGQGLPGEGEPFGSLGHASGFIDYDIIAQNEKVHAAHPLSLYGAIIAGAEGKNKI